MRRRPFLVVCLLMWGCSPLPPAPPPSAPAARSWTGKCVGVTDGDTIRVLHDGREEKIRLSGIDAPEKAQALGQRAKQATSALVFGQVVTVVRHDTDRYGRTVADVVTAEGRNVNRELVSAGMAWWYRQYAPGDRDLEQREAAARAAKRGLWADPSPVAPWDYRHDEKSGGGRAGERQRQEAVAPSAAPAAGGDTVYVTTNGRKYHAAGCPTLHGHGSPLSRAEAQARGYTACKVCGGG